MGDKRSTAVAIRFMLESTHFSRGTLSESGRTSLSRSPNDTLTDATSPPASVRSTCVSVLVVGVSGVSVVLDELLDFGREIASTARADESNATVVEVLSGVAGGALLYSLVETVGATSSGLATISTETSTTRSVPSGAMPLSCAV